MAEQGQQQGGSRLLQRDDLTPEANGWYCAVEVKGEEDPPKGGKETPPEQKIVIGEGETEQTLTVEQVTELVQGKATATQKSQEASELLQAAEKYGLDPKTYVEQAEGSFARFAELIQEGVIDEKGQIIKPVEPTIPKVGTSTIEPRPSETKALEVTAKALSSLEDRMRNVEDDQTSMIRMDIEREIKRQYPKFDSDDVSRLFGQAKVDRDQGKQVSIWERAKELSERKLGSMTELRKEHAKEFGIDLEKWDERNALKEQGAKGGEAPFLVGKKVVFNPKGKDEISPSQATQAQEEYEAGG